MNLLGLAVGAIFILLGLYAHVAIDRILETVSSIWLSEQSNYIFHNTFIVRLAVFLLMLNGVVIAAISLLTL